MGLTKTQQALITKARTAGASELGVALDDGMSSYIVAVVVRDLELLVVVPLVLSGYTEGHDGRRNDPNPELPPLR